MAGRGPPRRAPIQAVIAAQPTRGLLFADGGARLLEELARPLEARLCIFCLQASLDHSGNRFGLEIFRGHFRKPELRQGLQQQRLGLPALQVIVNFVDLRKRRARLDAIANINHHLCHAAGHLGGDLCFLVAIERADEVNCALHGLQPGGGEGDNGCLGGACSGGGGALLLTACCQDKRQGGGVDDGSVHRRLHPFG